MAAWSRWASQLSGAAGSRSWAIKRAHEARETTPEAVTASALGAPAFAGSESSRVTIGAVSVESAHARAAGPADGANASNASDAPILTFTVREEARKASPILSGPGRREAAGLAGILPNHSTHSRHKKDARLICLAKRGQCTIIDLFGTSFLTPPRTMFARPFHVKYDVRQVMCVVSSGGA
eukprot:4305141-Pleurochrysis_carterae.AAC.1